MISCPRKLALLVLFTALFLYTGCSEEPSLVQPDPAAPAALVTGGDNASPDPAR